MEIRQGMDNFHGMLQLLVIRHRENGFCAVVRWSHPIGYWPQAIVLSGKLFSNHQQKRNNFFFFLISMTSLDLGFGSTELLEPQYAFKNITEYVIHPSYDQSMKHHDLALIRLPQRIEESGSHQYSERTKCLI